MVCFLKKTEIRGGLRNKAIQEYKIREDAHIKNPNDLEKEASLRGYSKALIKHPNFMLYLKKNYPKMEKNVQNLAKRSSRVQSQSQDLSWDIER